MNKKRPAKKTFSSGFCKTKKNKEFNNKKSISKFAEGNKNKRFCSEDNITENSKIDKIESNPKLLKKARKLQKPNGSLIEQAKQIWNDLRVEELEKKKRTDLMKEIMIVISGRIQQMVFRHDAARIIQCCLKYGSKEQRSLIISELQERFVELFKQKYSKFLVPKMLKYGGKENRNLLISKIYGNVIQLLKHSVAGKILQTVYLDFATGQQRNLLFQDLLGPQFAVFKDKVIDVALVYTFEPENRRTLLKHLKNNIQTLLNKGVYENAILHQALHFYMEIADENELKEMVGFIKEIIIYILHTEKGSQVGMKCIWNSSAKDRKIILKSFKSFIFQICKEEYGQRVLLAALDSVDDTILIKHVVIKELLQYLNEIIYHKTARKVLLYLLGHREASQINKHILASLSLGDANPYSKKCMETRREELLRHLQDPLNEYLCDHLDDIVKTGVASQVILQAVINTKGNSKHMLVSALLDRCGGEHCLLKHDVSGLLVKRIILHSYNSNDLVDFPMRLWERLEGRLAEYIGSKQACYTIASLLSERSMDLADRICQAFSDISFDEYATMRACTGDPATRVLTAQGALKADLEKFSLSRKETLYFP